MVPQSAAKSAKPRQGARSIHVQSFPASFFERTADPNTQRRDSEFGQSLSGEALSCSGEFSGPFRISPARLVIRLSSRRAGAKISSGERHQQPHHADCEDACDRELNEACAPCAGIGWALEN